MIYQTLITSTTVGVGGASSITFSSIPATYTDLTLVFSLRDDAAVVANSPRVQLNSDTGANYTSMRYIAGTGSTTSVSGGSAGQTFFFLNFGSNGASSSSNLFSNGILYFPNYTSASAKSFYAENVAENNATAGYQTAAVGAWSGTAAISSIYIYNATFLQYSTVYLYGTLKGSGGATVS